MRIRTFTRQAMQSVGNALKRKIIMADSRPNSDVEQYALYNANHASFIVFDVDFRKLKHVKIYDLRFKDFANIIYLEKSMQTGAFWLRHKTNGYVFSLQSDAVEFKADTNDASVHLSIISTGEREIAISSNGFHVCADRNGTITISSPWIQGWEKFELITRRGALDLFEKRLLDPYPPRKSRRALQIASREKYGDRSFILSNVRVTATDWSLLCSNGKLLTPNAAHLQRGHSRDVILHQRPDNLKLKKACLIGGYYNYYHHLADYMINIFSIRNWIDQDLPLLTIKMENSFQREIVAAFDLDRQVTEMDHLSCVKIDELLVPEKAIVDYGIVRNHSTVRRCVEYLQNKLGISDTRKRRIFVSREISRTRRAINEDQAISIAEESGFEKAVLESMTFSEQVRIFSEAEAVIGLHGAGLTNLIFAPKNCLIVEIMPADGWKPEYFSNLSTGLGHRFERIFAKGAFESTNIEINIEALKRVLHQQLR